MLRATIAALCTSFLTACAADQRNATLHKVQRELPALVEGPEQLPAGSSFAFCFFREPDPNLFIAVSTDGYSWTEANNGQPVYTDRKLGLRDPSVAQGPGGTFHMVFTGGGDDAIGYSFSKDLVHWAPARAIKVMGSLRGTKGCWAPELVYDDAKKQWLIAWSSEVQGRFEETKNQAKVNHRLYYTTTKDFKSFTDPAILLDPGFTCIDSTFVKHDGAKGDHAGPWHLFFKDERDNPPKKQLRMVSGPSPQGPWSKPTEALTVTRVEAPCAVNIGKNVIVYFDEYRWSRYGAIRSGDLVSWSDVSKHMHFPQGARHGSVIKIPEALGRQLECTRPD
jgi:hypothetical protein